MGQDVLVGERVCHLQPFSDGCHLRARVLDSDAIGKAAEDEPGVAIFQLAVIGGRHQGHPEILLLREHKALGHSDHGGRRAVHAYRLTNDCRIFTEAPVPEAVAQNRDRRGTRCLIGRRKIPADNWMAANHAEGIGADLGRVVILRKAVLIAENPLYTSDNRHPLERLRLCAPIFKVGIGNATVARGGQVQQAIVLVHVREAVEEHGARDSKYGGVNPDADR